MSGECIAIVSGKGGAGKTSFAAAVGAALARTGRRVLCIDCAAGLRSLDLAMGLTDQALMDFSDVAGGRCSLEEAAAEHPRQPGLFLLNAPAQLPRMGKSGIDSGAESEGGMIRKSGAAWESGAESENAELLREARRAFDFCLLDAPPGLDAGFSMAVHAADRIVVLTLADPLSVRCAQRTVMELSRFPDGAMYLIVNRVRRLLFSRMRVTIDDIMDQTGLPLLGLIPEDDAVPLALAQGLPVTLSAPNSAAAKAFCNIAARITGQRVKLARMPW